MNRTAWGVVGVVLVAFAIWASGLFGGQLGGEAVGPGHALEVVGPAEADEVSLVDEVPLEELVVPGMRDLVPVSVDASDALADLPATNGGDLVFGGTVVIHQLNGAVLRDACGSVEFTLWAGNAGSSLEVDLVDGRFDARLLVQADGSFQADGSSFVKGTREGRVVVDEFDLGEAWGPAISIEKRVGIDWGNLAVELSLREVGKVTIEVRDRVTLEHLQDVTIQPIRDWELDHLKHPAHMAMTDPLALHVVSPIQLEPDQEAAERGQLLCLVGSPGYAWIATKIHFATSEVQIIDLEPGGDLEVFLDQLPALPKAWLRLCSLDQNGNQFDPISELPIDGLGPYRFEGLPPGILLAQIEVGDWWDSPLELGVSKPEIIPGQLTQINLSVEAPPVVERASFAGVFRVPVANQLKTASVELHLLDKPLGGYGDTLSHRRVNPGPTSNTEFTDFPFDFGEIQVGSYIIKDWDLGFSTPVEVPAQGLDNFIFQVPNQIDIRVLLRDATSGLPTPLKELSYMCGSGANRIGGALNPAERAPEDDWFHLRVPAAPVHISIDAFMGYSGRIAPIDASKGTEFIIDLTPSRTVTVKLASGATHLPWPSDFWPEYGTLDGTPKQGSATFRDGGFKLAAITPASIRITLPRIPGYAQHEPIIVEFTSDMSPEYFVELTKLE